VHWGLANEGRVVWETLADKDPEGVLKAAKDFGLYHGWTFALGDMSDKTIAGMTRSDRAHTAAEFAEIEAMVRESHAMTADFNSWPVEDQNRARHLIP